MAFTLKEINDKKIWEKFIKEHINTLPTSHIQSWYWGDFLRSLNDKIYRLGFYQNDKLSAVALGVKIQAKRGTYLHFRHGPVCDWGDKELVKFIINQLKILGKKEKACFIRISPLITPEEFSRLNLQKVLASMPSKMHSIDAEETWVIDLENKTDEDLLKNMRKNTRYLIRKAQKDKNLQIIKTQDLSSLEDFWPIYDDTVKRQKWTAYTHNYIQKQFEIFAKNDKAQLYLAKYKDRYIAGAIFIFYANQGVYQHSGSLTEFKKIPASYLLQWEAIKESKKRVLKKHNLWGVPLDKYNKLDQNNPWSGLGLFKVGFGGRAERWIHAQDIPINWKYYLTRTYEAYETFKRDLLKRSG